MKYELHHGDCLDVLRGMADASVDSIVTDPPYCSGGFSESARRQASGQGLRSETIRDVGWFVGDNMGTAGLTFLLRSVAFEAARIMRSSGSLLMFCDWRMVAQLSPAIESAGLRFQNLIVWDKGAAGLGTGFRAQHELIMHFTNGAPEYHSKSFGNVIKSRRVSATTREHQTQKPVDLMEQLIGVVTPTDGIVLDPFTGSGSTGVAAITTGRRFIGIEREAEYIAIARARIDAVQPQLFGAHNPA